MKRMNLPLLFVTACATVFMACKKEIVQSPAAAIESEALAKAGSVACAKKAQVVCGMLSFSDQAHFQYVYDCLYNANEAHQLSFETMYGYLSEDDYETMAESLNFVDEQALIDFESAIGFDSYSKAHNLPRGPVFGRRWRSILWTRHEQSF